MTGGRSVGDSGVMMASRVIGAEGRRGMQEIAGAREPARRFQDLLVWQRAHAVVLEVYRLTARFPPGEANGLTWQMRRAAISVPANLAEGFRKHGRADKVRYVNIAQGSLEETRYYLILAGDLGYADTGTMQGAVDEVGRMLDGYVRSIRGPVV